MTNREATCQQGEPCGDPDSCPDPVGCGFVVPNTTDVFEYARRVGFASACIRDAISEAGDLEEGAAYRIIRDLTRALDELDGKTTGGKTKCSSTS